MAYEKRTTAFERVNGDDALKKVRLNSKAVADERQVGGKIITVVIMFDRKNVKNEVKGEMDEKKLTDEIIKALEFKAKFDAKVAYVDGCACKHIRVKNILDLIHRLQDEVERLKPKKRILANRVYSDETLKRWKKEDLIEHIRILEHNWSCAEESYNNAVKNSDKIFAEQKAEIERLTEELEAKKKECCEIADDYQEMGTFYYNETVKTAELQKQVEYWESETKIARRDIDEAVKDTAKDIANWLPTTVNEDKNVLSRIIKEHYGVEVE